MSNTNLAPMDEKLDIEDVDISSLKHNENQIFLGMKTLEFGESQQGAKKTKYICLAECKRGTGLKIQIFSFDKDLGIQDLRKGQSIRIRGRLNNYKSSNGRLFYSIYVTELEKK